MKNKSLQLLVVLLAVVVAVGVLVAYFIDGFSSSEESAGSAQDQPWHSPEAIPKGWDFGHMVKHTGVEGEVSLTFDDGPSEYTPQILDILAERGITATFCMTGLAVEKHPDIARRVRDEGHKLCNHSYSHQTWINNGPVQPIIAEIDHTNEVIHREIGVDYLTWYRAPGGLFGGQVPQALAEKRPRGMSWDVDSNDWKLPGVGGIVDNVMGSLGPQSIILLHDGGGDRSQTVAALPIIIDRIHEAGYGFTTPGEFAH